MTSFAYDLLKLGASLLAGLVIGLEREENDKPCGMRTVTFISLGATLTVLATLKWQYITNSFDTIRLIAYYLVAIGFVGGGIISRKQGKIEGITTASLLLPVSVIGILCGMGEFLLVTFSTIAIYAILKLKYVRIKIEKIKKKNKHRKRK